MFDLDLSKFAFLNSEQNEVASLGGRESSNLPRPRLSKKNLKLHSQRFSTTTQEPNKSQIRVEIEAASICSDATNTSSDSEDLDVDTTLKTNNFDYDYASIYSEFSNCDSGHQTVSACGSLESRNVQVVNGFLAPPSPKSGRFRSVSFNEDEIVEGQEGEEAEQDEDGYSFVSYNSTSVVGQSNNKPSKGGNNAMRIVGSNTQVLGPFGPRKCVYLDQGRAVSEIERFIEKNVLTTYSQDTQNSKLLELRNEARQIIHKKCGGCEKEDHVIFCHSGTIKTLAEILVTKKNPSSNKASCSPIVVILGPYQTSSTISSWKMVAQEVILAPVSSLTGEIDRKELEGRLKSLKSKRMFLSKSRIIVGSFSAASGISGRLDVDDVAITALFHKYGAYSVWDYGVVGSHLHMEMNPRTGNEALDKLVRKDAIFFSGSGFLGGPQTPDVLIVKKSIFRNPQSFSDLVKNRSSSLIGEIRLGLAFQLQDSVGHERIVEKETDLTCQVLEAWGKVSEIVILGTTTTQSPRLPIISFLIKHPETGYYLHHEFVVALLRDLFGIQSRSGSMSDSSHSQELLGIGDKLAKKYEKCQNIMPGWTQIVLPHNASQAEISFTIDAIKLLASQGWKLLPFYEMDKNSTNGSYRYSGTVDKSQNVSLKSFTINSLPKEIDSVGKKPAVTAKNYRYDECLTYGKDLIDSIEMITQHNEIITHPDDFSCLGNPSLRWFLTPAEALLCIKHPYNVKSHFGTDQQKRSRCPFTPKSLTKDPISTSWSRGSIPHNYGVLSSPTIPPLPPRPVVKKKSSSLKSLDIDMISGNNGKKISTGTCFSRREFIQAQLKNEDNFEY